MDNPEVVHAAFIALIFINILMGIMGAAGAQLFTRAFIGKSQRRPLFLPRQLHTNASDGRRGNRQCPGETREALMPRISFNHVKVAHVFVAPLETDVYRRRHCSHFQIAPSASPV